MILSVSSVAKAFGGDQVLVDASLRVERREKVALIARNGAGKTTLLRIIVGEEEADSGHVHIAQGVTIGYLRQHERFNPEHTVLQEAEAARAHLVELQQRMRQLESQIETDSYSPEDIEEYSMLQEHFLEQKGYSVDSNVRSVLQRMGFDEAEFDKSVGALSGGETTRLTLAKLLLEEPELLILDEPTNHLDLEAAEWLENWLRDYRGACLMVSHDRSFLEKTVDRILELRNGTVKSYPGPFEHYLEVKAAEEAYQAEVAKAQKKEIAKLDEFVRRFINSQRTAQALGRQKLLNRMKESAIEAPSREKQMAAGFGKVERSGDLVLETKDLCHSFGEGELFHRLNWTVRFGERWGLIGANGAGKSTLAKICLGQIQPTQGSVRLGTALKVGYFSQDQSEIDFRKTPIEILNEKLRMEVGAARNLLGRFLISGDDALRPSGTLSWGERNKLALAMLTVQKPNLLILDEPTNHLDMASREALASVLAEYDGTLILISHDRWLLENVTNRTLDIRRDRTVQYAGSYDEYRESARPKANAANVKVKSKAATPPPKQESPLAYLTPRELSKEIGRVERLVASAESDITDQERVLEAIEREMAQPNPDSDIVSLSKQHQTVSDELGRLMSQWELHSRDLEELRALQGT